MPRALLAASDARSAGWHRVSGCPDQRAARLWAAVAAALGEAADAVVIRDSQSAVAAIDRLKREDWGRAGLLLGDASSDDETWPGLPDGVSYAIDVISECPSEIRPALSRLLAKVAIVADLDSRATLLRRTSGVTAVTKVGDLIGGHFAAGGSSRASSLIEVQAAVDEATDKLRVATASIERQVFELAALENERQEAAGRVDVALAKLHESDATLAAVAEELGQFGSQARNARAEAARLEQAIVDATSAREKDLAGLAELEQRLAAAQEAPDEEPDTNERDQLVELARGARAAETDARLALRTSEERSRALHGRADQLRRSAQAERDARAAAIARRAQLLREGEVGEAVGRAAAVVLARLEESIELAVSARAAVEDGRADRERALRECRQSIRETSATLDELVNSVHRDEMARAQQKMRIEQFTERALEELGLDAEALVAEYGPTQLVPYFGEVAEGELAPEPIAFEREQQVKRLRTAERALAQLGRINPLALEEFSALEERHRFLTEQTEDLKRTQKDLLDIVREVDERVQQVFADAYADVHKAFDETFARLFPGGEGRLVLTEPGDMLTTGVEVEARPPGKKVKRLSLLSGGERSLVAVAFLVALFKARPSPFYILDEVEAALDDTNLGRLLEIYEELRENSQLLVITHQKRTMEVGDALYGVSMRGDGVSAVISQRLREAESA
ncbi:MAG: AAA family ATPase [Marmoricola sp.]